MPRPYDLRAASASDTGHPRIVTLFLFPVLFFLALFLILVSSDLNDNLAASSDPASAQPPPAADAVLQVQDSPPAFDVFSLAFQPPNRDGVRALPRVDRTHLAQLDALALLLDPADTANPLHPSAAARARDPARWPPTVTALPAPSAPRRPRDPALCGAPRCRFLLPLRISEPEARARHHVPQLARLAAALGRTLVLPHAGRGRLGACFRQPLARYYDAGALSAAGPAARAVPLDAFQQWTRGRGPAPPSAQIAWLSARADAALEYSERAGAARPGLAAGVVASEIDEVVSRLPGCLDTKFALALDAYAPVFVRPERRALRGGDVGAAIADALLGLAGENGTAAEGGLPAEPADVLVVNWDLRVPIFPDAPKLAYSSDLVAAARSMTPDRPFVAVDWRMEGLDEETTIACAYSLVATLSNVLSDHNDIHDIWIGVDVPISLAKVDELDGPALLALQERGVREHHLEGLKILSRALSSGEEQGGWAMRGYEEFDKAGLTMETLQDVGVRDIISRLIGAEAALFVASGESCGKPSVSTQSLIEERQAAISSEAEPTAVRNDVMYFEQSSSA